MCTTSSWSSQESTCLFIYIHSVRRMVGLRNQTGICILEILQIFFPWGRLNCHSPASSPRIQIEIYGSSFKFISRPDLLSYFLKKTNFKNDQWWYNLIVIHIKFITSFQNSDPLSDNTAFGILLLQNKFTSAAATEVAFLSGKGYTSVHLENRSVIVKIMLFP